jgi:hypothetical protein
MSEPVPQKNSDVDEPPPILGSWRALYLLLIIELALLTLCGYVLGRWAA